jgi:hypothetical protein
LTRCACRLVAVGTRTSAGVKLNWPTASGGEGKSTSALRTNIAAVAAYEMPALAQSTSALIRMRAFFALFDLSWIE